MNKYYNFLEKISEDYNTEHKEIVSEKYWTKAYKVLDYLNNKYNRAEQITDEYRRLFIIFRMNVITNLPFYPENK